MQRPLFLLLLLGTVAACGDGQPLFDEDDGDGSALADTDEDGLADDVDDDDDGNGIRDEDEDIDGDGVADDADGDDDGDGIPDGDDPDADGDGVPDDEQTDGGVSNPDLPPGTETPTATNGIFRFEGDDGEGGGFVRDVGYDRATDTFTVDNLAFDGANVYARSEALPTLGGSVDTPAVYAVYEASEVELDRDGDPINQFEYRAIYGVSGTQVPDGEGGTEPATQFAIVRSGSYAGYGFGGFIYERNGGVDLPTSGQASYAGDYAGLRVFEGRADLEYTQGDVDIAIDFEDFDDGDGVQGVVSNRQAFDRAGNAIPLGGDGALILPDITFAVGPGVVTEDGEITAGLSSYTTVGGGLEVYEDGTYYAIVSGDAASEIVGVFVVESEDPRYEGVTAQETGGFIVYR